MFNFLPQITALGVVGLLGGLVGQAFNLLPTIIASAKGVPNMKQIVYMNMAYILVLEALAWSADKINNLTIVAVIFAVNFVAFWVFALVKAIRGK